MQVCHRRHDWYYVTWQLTAEDLLPVIDKINKTADDLQSRTRPCGWLLRSSGAAKIMNLS